MSEIKNNHFFEIFFHELLNSKPLLDDEINHFLVLCFRKSLHYSYFYRTITFLGNI